jgi:hypothetical protein
LRPSSWVFKLKFMFVLLLGCIVPNWRPAGVVKHSQKYNPSTRERVSNTWPSWQVPSTIVLLNKVRYLTHYYSALPKWETDLLWIKFWQSSLFPSSLIWFNKFTWEDITKFFSSKGLWKLNSQETMNEYRIRSKFAL